MSRIKIYNANDIEYQRLSLFTRFANKEFYTSLYCVQMENIYFDFGQNWKYTGLITYDNNERDRHWQSVCPRDYELIVTTDSISKMKEMAIYYAQAIKDGNICVNLFEKFE